MPGSKPVTLYQVKEHKVFVGDGRDFLRMRSLGPLKLTTCDDLVYPLTQEVRDIDLPIHKLRFHGGPCAREMLVAIGDDAMDVFDAVYSKERARALADLNAERKARADALARIENFNNLPLLKRIWRAIRKTI